jgi:selenocysteine lyase/cysteine desulfurase
VVHHVNERRPREDERLLFVVDGVHGFGIEDATFPALGCDFFIAGCHKLLFGPRGTAVICGRADAWPHIHPFFAKLSGANDGPASRHVPGGVKAYEHWWALAQAFDFHVDVLDKKDVQARVRELAARLKAGLSTIEGVTIVTPADPELSSGLVCIDIAGRETGWVIKQLRASSIVASSTALDEIVGTSHVRFSVSVVNNEVEVDGVIDAVARAAASHPDPETS